MQNLNAQDYFLIERPEIVKIGDRDYIAVHVSQGADKRFSVNKTNYIPLSESALTGLSDTVDDIAIKERAKFLEVLEGKRDGRKASDNVTEKNESVGRKKAGGEGVKECCEAVKPAPEAVERGSESGSDEKSCSATDIEIEPGKAEPCLKKITIGCEMAGADFSVLKGVENKDPDFIIADLAVAGVPVSAPKSLAVAFMVDMQGSPLAKVRVVLKAMVDEVIEDSRKAPPTVVTETAPVEIRKEYIFEIPYGPRVKEFEKLIIKNKIALTSQTNDQTTDLVIFRVNALPSEFLKLSEQYEEIVKGEDAMQEAMDAVATLTATEDGEPFIRGNPAMSKACFELIELQTSMKAAEALRRSDVLKAAGNCTTEMIRRKMIFFRGGVVSGEVVELFEKEFAALKVKS